MVLGVAVEIVSSAPAQALRTPCTAEGGAAGFGPATVLVEEVRDLLGVPRHAHPGGLEGLDLV
jgi:hypothetical protein